LPSDHQDVEFEPVLFGVEGGLMKVFLDVHTANICMYIYCRYNRCESGQKSPRFGGPLVGWV
jgi:hypothetical protein